MATRLPRTRYVGLVGAALTVFTVLVLLMADSASSGSTGQENQVTQRYPVTLVTGDRVVLSVQPDGERTVTVADVNAGGRRAAVGKNFRAIKQNGDVYVFPIDPNIYISTLLDRELFNVSKLVRQGYGDRSASSIPLIVDYRSAPSKRTLPGDISKTLTLRSLGAVAGRMPKAHAEEFGRALERQLKVDAAAIRTGKLNRLARSGPFAGVKRIYLDEKVKAALADSVPQIGAPQAWAAGYDGTGVDVAVLDTGIDATHADLQGKIASQANFTDEASTVDGNGHGTHVASTVAGGGQASGGARKGVAPGADLMIGKVLNSFGSGLDSWVMAGMEWAAQNGADVISMSLQAGVTDGTDPTSQLVNQLTQQYGVLFTIAAGNFGPATQTLTAPGAANQALTVGAVDKSNVLAGFSGRGPRFGDFALKPDITAPGVDIIAARAAGTALGQPIDDFYTMLSGTSMATPHIAGAAAILRQEFPSFTPAQLKAALMSTALPGPYSVYEQGAGRVDVARAYSQKVYSNNAPVDFGYFVFPHDNDQPVTKAISYSNYTASDVTLALTVDVTTEGGAPAAPGMVTTSVPSITVPAGGTASVDVTVNTQLGANGLYGGVIRAQSGDGSVVVRTPVGFYKEPESYNLTVEGIAHDGRPPHTGVSWVEVVNADDTTKGQQTKGFAAGPPTFRLAAGTYSVMAFLGTADEANVFAIEEAMVGDPELELTQNTTLVLDGRKATEVLVNTAKPTEAMQTVFGYYRAGAQFGSWESLFLVAPPINRVFAAPTEQVTKGDFGFRAKPSLRAPELDAAIAPPDAMDLDAIYAFGSPKVDGSQRLDLVYAGYGREEDYQGLNVQGKAVLVSRGPLPPIGNPITFAEKVQRAQEKGAAVAIIHNHSPGLLLISIDPATTTIPVMTLTQAQGVQLRDLIQGGAKLTLTLNGVLQSPYLYDVIFAERGRIQDTHTRTLNQSNTVQIDAGYHAQVPSWLAGEARHAYPPWSGFSFEGARNFNVPFARTDYVAPGDSRWFHVAWGSMTNDHVFEWSQQDPIVTYPGPAKASEDWFAQPQRPGVIRNYEIGDNGEPVVREGNTITGFVPSFQDPWNRWGLHDSRTDSAPFQLFENGSLIAQSEGFFGSYAVSGNPASYRAELDVTRTAPYWTQSTNTHTTWTFDSAPPAGVQPIPLLLVDYSLKGLDLQNRSPRGTQVIDLFAHRQQGASAASITGLTASVSYNDGANWLPVTVKNNGGGHFSATIKNPNVGGPAVSLRVEATDSGGSGITQTIIRAYGLK